MVVPVLDASRFVGDSPTDRFKFAEELLDSLQKHGFVRLRDHGISDETVEEMFRLVRQPSRTKISAVYEKISGGGLTTDSADCKEHFDQGPANDEQFPNKWPSEVDLPNFRTTMENFYLLAETVSLYILEALEMALKLPQSSFLNMMVHNASELRLNHYPAISIADMREKNINRTSPHFDLGVITLLFQDGIGGLEIQDRDRPGSFMPVEPSVQSEMMVNVAETFLRWTNDVVSAGLHRVTIPESLKEADGGLIEERFSVVYLCKADRDASVAPLKEFVTEKGSKYGHISALEYHQQRLGLAYQ
ncbi:hypothetical protein G7Y89_g8930 [Cudoniella acicularis]|uniref:Fe2OG dioxygenase domain-containing protein n=1 Tax=Cudoniella acicularis TaxID=354080 RepID=A0A8H4W0L7_9HELO|nr:hypothetical protein G7Y89_g8930 [Cudoniella acicularis]